MILDEEAWIAFAQYVPAEDKASFLLRTLVSESEKEAIFDLR